MRANRGKTLQVFYIFIPKSLQMKILILTFFLLPIFSQAQKISQVINPEDHSLWLLTDIVTLKGGLTNDQVHVKFKVEGTTAFIYVMGDQQPVTERDWAAFYTSTGTVIAHSTGVQPGPGFHEYKLDAAGLSNLTLSPVTKVVLSSLEGFQETEVPADYQARLTVYAAALLKQMNNWQMNGSKP